MNRRTSMFTGLLLAMAPLAFSQGPQNQTNPLPAADPLATQLIAWSSMQRPQPAPQPLPPPDRTIPQPDPQTTQPPTSQAQDQAPDAVQDQTFTGKIVKDGNRYVLKVSSNTAYQLAEQSSAKQYENQDVKIVGTLETATNTIHVVKIELLS